MILQLEKTKRAPQVSFDPEKGSLEIIGRSIMENTVGFYSEILEAILFYAQKPCDLTTVKVHLDYFNTASSKSILEIFKKFEAIHKNGNNVEITWYFDEDDEDMIDAGEDYQAIVKVPFNIVSTELI
tara:strand:- start:507 stop:887 length:381 start_codon:yes stop_codon:yes gene_type:complete